MDDDFAMIRGHDVALRPLSGIKFQRPASRFQTVLIDARRATLPLTSTHEEFPGGPAF